MTASEAGQPTVLAPEIDARVRASIAGDSRPLVAHLAAYPLDALLLSAAVPTIAFAGATEVPEEAWQIVEQAAPAYGDDWWFTGLLAFVRPGEDAGPRCLALSGATRG